MADKKDRSINVFAMDLFTSKREDLFALKMTSEFSFIEELSTLPGSSSIITSSKSEANIGDLIILRVDLAGSDCNNNQSCKALFQETQKGCQNDSGIYVYDFSTKKVQRLIKPAKC